MHISNFDFELPKERIAQDPVSPRDAARLLHISKDGLDDYKISDIPAFLKKGDILIVNDTKVIPARIYGKRGEANIEVMLHKHIEGGKWEVFARPAKKLKIGNEIIFAEDFKATVYDKNDSGTVIIEFSGDQEAFWRNIHTHGIMPLPPYIERDKQGERADTESYQTIFAKQEGAVAAPTAGLHFTQELLAKLNDIGVEQYCVTLHVGAGTFLPVKVENIEDHNMHAEFGTITKEVAEKINQAKQRGNNIIAVGTTSLRLLESAATKNGHVEPFSAETSIFISPGYKFKIVDKLITNFHLPKSTLFMLVSAFSGLKTMHKAYKHAIKNEYRFYSYGDACLLERNEE